MDFDEEPMDVDLSANSIRHIDAMDISYNDSYHESLETSIKTPRSSTIIKRYSLQRKDHRMFSNTVLSVVFFVLSLLSLLIYHVISFECSRDLDLNMLKKSLSENLIGQNQAIKHIIDSLEEESRSKVLLFYGGTGVGKTLTTQLILENIHHYPNIYHYIMPSFVDTFSTELMLGLTFCPTSTIIVDDLNSIDMHVVEHIQNILEKSENLNKNITIILVFNCDTINEQYVKKCDNSFSIDLQNAFRKVEASKSFIKFNSLSEEHLQKCIEKELGEKTLSESDLENIVKNFNVSLDGCKGVHTKTKLLNIN